MSVLEVGMEASTSDFSADTVPLAVFLKFKSCWSHILEFKDWNLALCSKDVTKQVMCTKWVKNNGKGGVYNSLNSGTKEKYYSVSYTNVVLF